MTLNGPGPTFTLPPPLNLGDLYKQQASGRSGGKAGVSPAKKGAPWSDDEHKAFLTGLKIYGRGQWKQISRFYVPSRTPTQVASHAQKHFLRQSGAQKRRSRFTAVEDSGGLLAAAAVPPQQAPGPAPMPSLFAHTMLPVQHSYHLPPPRQASAPRLSSSTPPPFGSVVGGIAMGVPIGVLPPLPCITTASGTELPILPVMPGRINAMTSATVSYSYSDDSSGGGCGSDLQLQYQEQHQDQQQHSSKPPSPQREAAPPPPVTRAAVAAAAAAAVTAVGVPLPRAAQYTPNSRAQQLLRLLELNEQLVGGSNSGADGASSGSFPAPPPGMPPQPTQPPAHSAVRRVPSATAALDTLASLAEAESQSQAASQGPAATHCAQTMLVSAC